MTVLYENEKVQVNYIGEIKMIEFIVLQSKISITEKRTAWDETIELMKSLKLNKIFVDERKIEYPDIGSFLYCNEGLVQIMARAIKSPKLYCALGINETLLSEIDEETKFSSEFNQHNEIDYNFFIYRDEGFRWLISKPNPKLGFLSNLINSIFKPRKTQIEEQLEYNKKAMGYIENPLTNQLMKEDIERFKKANNK